MTQSGETDQEVKKDVPSHKDLFNPLLEALHDLGGSGAIDEITQGLF
jgi:hypothetical protein